MGPRILISGASGLVGTALCAALREAGYHVIPLVRSRTPRARQHSNSTPSNAAKNDCVWNPESTEIPEETLAAFDHAAAVIHLGGEPLIGNRPWTMRWTSRMKTKIRRSRVESTALLARTFVQMRHEGRTPPRHFFVASGVGYYGHDGCGNDEYGQNDHNVKSDECGEYIEHTEDGQCADRVGCDPRVESKGDQRDRNCGDRDGTNSEIQTGYDRKYRVENHPETRQERTGSQKVEAVERYIGAGGEPQDIHAKNASQPCHLGMSIETSPCGTSFLAELARDWETAAAVATEAGCRVVSTRFGVILDPAGGMLGRMLPLFRAGVAVRWGDGRTPLSWIGLSDVVAVFMWLLRNRQIEGPVNVCAPVPTTFGEFCQLLGELTETRMRVTVPTWLLRFLGGEMANEMFLHGQRAYPKRLLCEGFGFRYPDIASLLIDFFGPTTLPLVVSDPPTSSE
ncbi:MAG: DUF1731 domain-containing protein [Thermoguttaceae bacterium]|nr:DUF1731 domain-containing protein [Thermoguttaceae bacterium]